MGQVDTTQHMPSSPPRRRRKVRVALLLLAAVFGVCFGRFAWLRITLEPTPRPHHYEALILALDPAPDDPAIAEQAMDLLGSPPWAWDEAPTDFFCGADVTTRPAVDAEWAKRNRDINTVVLGPWDANRPDMAAAAAIFSWDGFEEARRTMGNLVEVGWQEKLDLSTGWLPSFSMYRAWSRWLVAHSRWIREEQGDLATAVQDWLIALRLGRQTRRLQLPMPQLGASSIASVVASEVRLAAREGMGTVDTAALLREMDAILGPLQPPSQLMEGERLWMHHYMESVFVQEAGDWLVVNAVSDQPWGSWLSGGVANSGSASRVWNLTSPLFHNLASARANVDTYFTSFDVCADLALCERAKRPANGIMAPQPGALDGFGDSPRFFPPIKSDDWRVRVLQYVYIARCELDAAVTMLALEQYRQAEGRYPEQLDQLIPRFLHRLPVDYGDRQPLRYRPEGREYVLYSIGVNGLDDGGVAEGKQPDSFHDNQNLDVVFSLTRRKELDE